MSVNTNSLITRSVRESPFSPDQFGSQRNGSPQCFSSCLPKFKVVDGPYRQIRERLAGTFTAYIFPTFEPDWESLSCPSSDLMSSTPGRPPSRAAPRGVATETPNSALRSLTSERTRSAWTSSHLITCPSR